MSILHFSEDCTRFAWPAPTEDAGGFRPACGTKGVWSETADRVDPAPTDAIFCFEVGGVDIILAFDIERYITRYRKPL